MAKPGQFSNLDSTRRRVVRKGSRVSLDARHWHVSRVRLGVVYIKPVNPFGTVLHENPVRIVLTSDVQVVA